MAARDLEAFLRERLLQFDPNIDVSAGGALDTKVIQPTVRRLGTDPFTVDLATFLHTRLEQAFPELAADEGDALNDLLVKPNTLLWDSIVREVQRVRQCQSFANPATLTLDEADALGAVTFNTRNRGDYAKTTVRVSFSSPRDLTANPTNFATSKGGLKFYPLNVQTIKSAEMLLNQSSDGLFYFDFDVIAEAPGSQYNVEKDDIISIAGIPAAVKVTNIRRATNGLPEESVEEFIGRGQQEIGERSLSTLRGVAAKLTQAFPELTRLNVVGFGDVEMQRDVLTGGSLGPVAASGLAGTTQPDMENRTLTRRFHSAEVDFISLVGTSGLLDTDWVVTTVSADGEGLFAGPFVDHRIRRVLDENTVEFDTQTLRLGASSIAWSIRSRTLSIGNMPGGILAPNAGASLQVRPDEVHVGGTQDVYIRGAQPSEKTTVLTSVADESPALQGMHLQGSTGSAVVLSELRLGVNYARDDETWKKLLDASTYGWSFRIDGGGPCAGNYRVLSALQIYSSSPVLTVTPALPTAIAAERTLWSLFDSMQVDLLEPKEVRLHGTQVSTVQGSNVVRFSGVDLRDYGAQNGDTLHLKAGPDSGYYTLTDDPLAPDYNTVPVSGLMKYSTGNVDFILYRSLGTGVSLPLQRVTRVELLDANQQPTGTLVPYGAPVDAVSRAFQNPARGIQHDFEDGVLGIVSVPGTGVLCNMFRLPGTQASANTLDYVYGLTSTYKHVLQVPALNVDVTRDELVVLLNSVLRPSLGLAYDPVVTIGDDRLGVLPVQDANGQGLCFVGGTLMTTLFNSYQPRTIYDVRSETVDSPSVYGWGNLSPVFDAENVLSAIHIAAGAGVGDYGGPFSTTFTHPAASGAAVSTALIVGFDVRNTASAPVPFSPEVGKRLQVGLRSIGSARVLFQDVTTFEVDAHTIFTLDSNGRSLRYVPDPSLTYQCIPPLPGGAGSGDGESQAGGDTFTASSQDFLLSSIVPGDYLEVGYAPLSGTVTTVTDAVANLAFTTLVFSVNDGEDRTVTFIRDDITLPQNSVSKNSIVRQINAALGQNIASWDASGHLVFTADTEVVVRRVGTANDVLLGNVAGTSAPTVRTFSKADQNNRAPCYGTYVIRTVAQKTLTIEGTFPTNTYFPNVVISQTYRVLRSGVQRVSATQMADNKGEAGFYYADIELISEGIGDLYNVEAGKQFSVAQYRCDGYTLSTEDPNFSFSTLERPWMTLSRSVLPAGVDDSPQLRTQLAGRSLLVTYEVNNTVGEVQSYVSSDTERVLNASSLVRSLICNYVRLDLQYAGGSREDVVMQDLQTYIKGLTPIEPLQVSRVQKILTDRGASHVKNPFEVIALTHNLDRTITVQRSADAITAGRLSTYLPDVLTVKKVAG